jgi:hypothetical protein
MSPNGDFPTIWGGGKILGGATVSQTYIKQLNQQIISIEGSIGPSFGGAGGVRNSKIIWRR